jgi:cobalt/nickel transport system ATP-binding protein
MSEIVIRSNALCYSYAAAQAVLERVSFGIKAGERVGVIGANGAGKSTLLSLLAGVMAPDDGTLEVGGVLSKPNSLPLLRARAGLVFQNPDDMLFMPTVAADVAFGPERRGLAASQVASIVERSLKAAGVQTLAFRAPWSLSGGEKRAVSVAAVLAMEPEVLLLDEPTSGLDPASRRELIGLIRSLEGTVIIASHDLDMVMDTCDRVLVLGHKTIAADGPAAAVLGRQELLEENRLELPLRLQACPRCSRSLSQA